MFRSDMKYLKELSLKLFISKVIFNDVIVLEPKIQSEGK
jgi:hypothetical protein